MVREQERISLAQLMAAILLILAGTLLFFYHLGKTDFARDTPARIAVYTRQMNEGGQWLTPVLRGEPRLEVPPLYLWATRIFSGFSATVTPLQERFAGAVCAMLLVLLAAWWLYRHAIRYSREDMAEATAEGFALLGGLILASNPVFFSKGREGTLNTMFVLFYSAAAFCWSESLEARRSFYAGRPWRNWVMWGYVLAGVAMLVRGPLVLPLLIVPYFLAARSYHLHRLDRVHLAGLPLALAIGGSWPLLITLFHPGIAGIWKEWLSLHMGNLDASSTPFYEFLWHILASSFPWNLLALVMAWRIGRRKDRSPTLVFWMSSLLGNLLVLTFLSNAVGQHRLPVIFFITLMAADAIYRWNFENAWAMAWRVLLRVLLVLGILLTLCGAVLLKSGLGLLLVSLVPLAWAGWAVRSRLGDMQYTPWETTMRLSAMVVCVLIAGEAVYLSDYEPKQLFFDGDLAYVSRIKRSANNPDARFFMQNNTMDIRYDYLLNTPPLLDKPIATLRPAAGAPAFDAPVYLAANEGFDALARNPYLQATACLWGKDHTRLQEGLLRVTAPAAANPATTPTQEARQPQRLALLGNQGTRSNAQKNVGKRLAKVVAKQPLEDVLLLGNNIYGPSTLKHLDFVNAFEKPYWELLKRGVTFHATLGREDQSFAWLEGKYPPFNMNKHRYYSLGACAGLVEAFMLDGERLYQDKKFDEAQLKWLEDALARSRAPWKVVCLNQSLASAANDADVNEELAGRLLPLLDRGRVSVVAWAGGPWYERLALPGHAPAFLNGGWSGKKPETSFKNDPRLKLGYNARPGFVILEFEEARAVIRAIDDNGTIVDTAVLSPPGK